MIPWVLLFAYRNDGWHLWSRPLTNGMHDDVIKWKHFPRYWPFVRGIHRSPVYSPHKGQWRGASMFSLISFWINGWINNREAGDLRRCRAHYDVIVMGSTHTITWVECKVISPAVASRVRYIYTRWETKVNALETNIFERSFQKCEKMPSVVYKRF